MNAASVQIGYILGKAKSVAKLAKEWRESNSRAVIFTDRYQGENAFPEIMGKDAEGTYILSLPTLKDNPDFTETLVKLRLLGIEPHGLSVYGYSAVRLWEELVKEAGSFLLPNCLKKSEPAKLTSAGEKPVSKTGFPIIQSVIGYIGFSARNMHRSSDFLFLSEKFAFILIARFNIYCKVKIQWQVALIR